MIAPLTPAAIDAATPPDRNRYADALRLASIAVVVLGHWLLAVIVLVDGRLVGDTLLAVAPWTRWLTWVFQVMPLFFLVGGYANAAAWESARARGQTWPSWVGSRARRLLAPAVPLFAVWVPAAAVVAWAGVPDDLLRLGTQIVIVPLWFLAVYLLVVTAVPLTHAWHRARPGATLAALVGAAVVIDVAHRAGVPLVGWVNFAVVWATVHQAGYWWRDGREPRRAVGALGLAAVGFAALAVLVFVAGYPLSMVGVDGGADSNNLPPSVALLVLATGQAGLALALRGPAERLLARPVVWAGVVVGGSRIMTVYLWHMTAMVVVAAAVYPIGLLPAPPGGSAAWWLSRPLWFVLCGVALAGLVAVFGRFEQPPRPLAARRPRGTARTALGVAATAAGLALLVTGGLHRGGGPLAGVALAELGLLACGLGLLGVLARPRRTPDAADEDRDALERA